MDKEIIIKLAQEAHYKLVTKDYVGHMKQLDPWTMRLLERFANLIAQHEREECAKVCDDINAKYKWPDDVAERVASQWCADSIRARGKNETNAR